MSAVPEQMRNFVRNRAAIPSSELAKYAGKYVAWSPDGKHIIASAEEETFLDDLVRKVGENPSQCAVGWLTQDDALVGGLKSL